MKLNLDVIGRDKIDYQEERDEWGNFYHCFESKALPYREGAYVLPPK